MWWEQRKSVKRSFLSFLYTNSRALKKDCEERKRIFVLSFCSTKFKLYDSRPEMSSGSLNINPIDVDLCLALILWVRHWYFFVCLLLPSPSFSLSFLNFNLLRKRDIVKQSKVWSLTDNSALTIWTRMETGSSCQITSQRALLYNLVSSI